MSTVEELKDVLKKKHGYDGRELRNKDEEWLLNELAVAETQSNQTEEIDFGSLEIEDDTPQVVEQLQQVVAKEPPRFGSRDWHEHVMSMFFDNEVTDGHPNVEGLRRVAQLQIGHITEDVCEMVQTPNPTNHFTATALCRMTVSLHENVAAWPGQTVIYQDVADASKSNTPEPFNLHLSSTASSRAESRVLRKILGLNKIVSAEELVPEGAVAPSGEEETFTGPQFITDQQITVIDMFCRNLDINPIKYLNSGQKQYKLLTDIPRKVASEAIGHLHKYEKGQTPVPSMIKGYDANWKPTEE